MSREGGSENTARRRVTERVHGVGLVVSAVGYWRHGAVAARNKKSPRHDRGKSRGAKGSSSRRAAYRMAENAGCKFTTRVRSRSESSRRSFVQSGQEILRSHGHVKPSLATFCLLPSMHERPAFVFRDFSTRLSGSLDFSPPPPLSFLLAGPHANGVARNRRAGSERSLSSRNVGSPGRKRTRGGVGDVPLKDTIYRNTELRDKDAQR